MTAVPAWVCLLMGLLALGAGWLIGRRRAHALELELAKARAESGTAAELAAERERSLDLALARLRSGFDAMAGEALRGNSETFLQLARQALGQQQEVASRSLAEREKAVETLLAPVREALERTHQQIARIEKERAESFGKPALQAMPEVNDENCKLENIQKIEEKGMQQEFAGKCARRGTFKPSEPKKW